MNGIDSHTVQTNVKQHETDEVYDSLFVDDEQHTSVYANKFIACSNRIPKKQARTL